MKYYIIVFLSILLLSCGGKIDKNTSESNENIDKKVLTTQKENKKIVKEKQKIIDVKNEERKDKVVKPDCSRQYDFYDDISSKTPYYRRFEFIFKGDCKIQDKVEKYEMSGNLFKISSGQQAFFSNSYVSYGGLEGNGGASLEKEVYSETFTKDNFSIEIRGGIEGDFDAHMRGETNTLLDTYVIQIFISSINSKGGISLYISKIPKGNFDKEYNDLLWTMRNGFRELK